MKHPVYLNSPDGKTHNQIDHILIDRRWLSIILDVRSFRKADCDTDHYLVFANLGNDWQYVSKQHRCLMGKDLISGG